MNEIREKSERMRRNYPLRDLLAHKESELTQAVREFKKLPSDAPGRGKAEALSRRSRNSASSSAASCATVKWGTKKKPAAPGLSPEQRVFRSSANL